MTTNTELQNPIKMNKSRLVQAWLVLLLAMGFGASLASVQMTLGPKIALNKTNETLGKVPVLVLGKFLAAKMAAENKALQIAPRRVVFKNGDVDSAYRVYEIRYQNDLRGWVVKALGQGYAGPIELLLGLSPDLNTITGLFVLDQKETPGLGNKIVASTWRSQFIQKPTDPPLVVVKAGSTRPGGIDAITGATISSRSVADTINKTVRELRRPLAQALSHEKKETKSNG